MKLNSLLVSLTSLSLLTISCANTQNQSTATSLSNNTTKPEMHKNYDSTKWYRTSAEKTALYRQIFSFADEKITAKVKSQKLAKNSWGIILDVDETVIDNSAYAKHNVENGKHYTPATNHAFMNKAISPAIAGAAKFTCDIHKAGGKVVFVTNRNGNFDDKIQDATVLNLKQQGICFDNVVFANGAADKDKTPRYMAVASGDYSNIVATKKIAGFKVIAYLGDNFQDFPHINQKEAMKKDPNGSYFNKFGDEFFIFPNPTYGSWEANKFR